MSSSEIPRFTHMPPGMIQIDESLQMRLFVESDAENLLRLVDNERAQKFLPWAKPIHDLESAKDSIASFQSAWDNQRMARYVVEKDGEFAGYAGIWSDQEPDFYEFGFATLPELQGEGIGSKSVNRLINMARDDLGAKGMIAYVDDTNEQSKSSVSRLGFEPTEEFDSGDRRYVLDFDEQERRKKAFFNGDPNTAGSKGLIFIGDSVVVYRRDDNTDDHPHQLDLPGGGPEQGETPFQTFQREAMEEFNLGLSEDDIIYVRQYPSVVRPGKFAYFPVAKLPESAMERIRLGDEGSEYLILSFEEYLSRTDAWDIFQDRSKDYRAVAS